MLRVKYERQWVRLFNIGIIHLVSGCSVVSEEVVQNIDGNVLETGGLQWLNFVNNYAKYSTRFGCRT